MAGTSLPLAPSAPTASPGSHDEHHQGVDPTPLPAHNDLSYSAPLPAMARQSRFLPPLAKQRKEQQAKDKAQQRRALPQPSPQAEQPCASAPLENQLLTTSVKASSICVLQPLENKCSKRLLHEKALQARKSHH